MRREAGSISPHRLPTRVEGSQRAHNWCSTPFGITNPFHASRFTPVRRLLEGSLALEEAHRIEWCRAPADLEVQLRRVDIAGLARVRNYLPALDLVTKLAGRLEAMPLDSGSIQAKAWQD